MIKLFAFDLDGTLTQHKTPLEESARETLAALGQNARLCMVGAGMCRRVFEQMNHFPIDIIGNYGMQVARVNNGVLETVADYSVPVDRESIEKRVTFLREKFGYCDFKGENVEYHTSGCITIPLLGTAAEQTDKLLFDPTREKRRRIYGFVKELFPDYTVFVGGTSSFDMAPMPFNKYYALDKYCAEKGISHSETVYAGDDYGPGGNDESVFLSDFNFVKIDDYRDFPEKMKEYIK